ncbi:MAG: ArsR family transcriptional regulator, partial [Spirochaetaceae bacterium]
MNSRLLLVEAEKSLDIISALNSETRLQILKLLNGKKLSINNIAEILGIPQSTASTNITILEKAGLVSIESAAGIRGAQKLCQAIYDEIAFEMPNLEKKVQDNIIEVMMPIGLYTDHEIVPPCGMCSTDEIIGYLDSSDTFLNPKRAVAGLLWFGRGFVEYKFPNNIPAKTELEKLELTMELSSEVPGTNKDWPSDITVWINRIEIGTWTSPGDFGDVRGKLTPPWWKLAGSQYGLLKQWGVTPKGTFVDGVKVSEITLEDLALSGHTSIKVKIGIKDDSRNIGGVNIFGRGFGNYD